MPPDVAAGNSTIDDVIDPRETRPVLAAHYEMAVGKRVERPWRRNAVVPASKLDVLPHGADSPGKDRPVRAS